MTDTTARPVNAGPRTLKAIAADISTEWGAKVNFAAKPYLEALHSLEQITDSYGADNAEGIVRYFLSNASQFKGARARELKEELRAHLPRRSGN